MQWKEVDDGSLVSGMLAHDSCAWREFHRRFDALVASRVRRVAARFAGVAASDVVDEVSAQLAFALTESDMEKLRSFDGTRGALPAWLATLATRAAWDHLRSTRRTNDHVVLDDAREDEASSPHEHLELREEVRAIARGIESLSDRDRAFVQLYFVDELEPEAIAKELSISITTVYTKRHKIQQRLVDARLAA